MKVARERASEHAGCKNGTDGAGVLGPDGLRGTFVIWAKPYINKLPINRHRAAATRNPKDKSNNPKDKGSNPIPKSNNPIHKSNNLIQSNPI